MKNNKSEPIPVMDYRQYRRVRRLVHECCNYIDGNCIALDDGEECVCVQSISYSLLCRWFRAAVLPQDKELETALFHRLNAKKCAVCGALFTPGSNRAKYCPECAARMKRINAAKRNAEDDENASNEDKATNPPTEQENGENGANTEPDKATEEQQEDKVIIPQGKMRVTVICDGSLNIRRSAAWGNDNICGRAIRGQSYYVKEIHVVDGKKMVRTIGDLYLSGESEHVQFEQL